MNRGKGLLFVLMAGLVLLASACRRDGPKGEGTDGGRATASEAGTGHVHERGKMLIADAGKHHALLTAHLSPKGNELDIFFETDDKQHAPVAIAAASFTAFARRQGGEVKEVRFECAPPEERPKGEVAGTCSHFVAKTPWLTREEALEVTIPSVKIGDSTHQVKWKGFTASRYAHHEEK